MPTASRPILIALVLAAGIAACRSRREDPALRETALATYRAHDARDWATLARLVDPAALDQFRTDQLALARSWRAHVDSTLSTPGARLADSVSRAMSTAMYGVASAAELERLPAESVFVRRMRYADAMLDAVPELRFSATRTIVGTVMEGDSAAHLIVRVHTRWSNPPPPWPGEQETLTVLTLRRRGAAWRPSLNGGLAGGIDLINAVQ